MSEVVEYDVRIAVAGITLRRPLDYHVEVDLLEPADAFSFVLPLDKQTWHRAEPDSEVVIFIAAAGTETAILSGFIDDRKDRGDGRFEVSGRDRTGRLVQESVPGAGLRVGGQLLGDVAHQIVAPWYPKIIFDNARNRRLVRGRGPQSRAGKEPALTAKQAKTIPRRIAAGTPRWSALQRFLSPLELLAWGQADGEALVIARPHYEQEAQYEFFETLAGPTNVLHMGYGESVADRFASIETGGTGRRTSTREGAANRAGIARNGPNPDGTGEDFQHPKRLFVPTEARSAAEAQREAERILAERDAGGRVCSIRARGHGQTRPGASRPVIFAPDTVCRARKEVEKSPTDGRPAALFDSKWYVTAVTYSGSRTEQQSEITLVPTGTRLSL